MRVHLKLAAYALALAGLWSVTFTDYFSPVYPLASAGVVLLGWFFEGPKNHRPAYRRIWWAIGLVMLLFFPFDIVLTRSLLLPPIHLSLFAQAYFLLNSKNANSYRLMFIVSFMQLLASTNLTTDLRFGFIISIYSIVAVYFVLLMYISNGLQQDQKAGEQKREEEMPQGLFMLSLVLAVALLPLSLGFFYSMPRLRYALIARGNPIDSLNQMQQVRQRTGFSRVVQLGTYGRVQEDQTLALRVEIPSANGRPLDRTIKWRNGALNIYDGVAWSSSRDFFRYYNGKEWSITNTITGLIFPRSEDIFITDGLYGDYTRPEQLDADPTLLKQIFYLEVPYTESLFGADEIKAFEGPFTYGIGRDFNAAFYIRNRQSLPDLISYTVYSSIGQPSPDQLIQISNDAVQKFTQEESYSAYVKKSFLQLPTGLNPQIRELALQISKDASTPYEKALAIQHFLESRYTYSLNLAKPITDDPLYDFLFVSKSGHCEYFATAMAIMCRSIGIPSRLARGFLQGEWNESGSFYEVRQKDSHAWVEVLFPGFGWVPFDPSPRAAADEYFSRQRSPISKVLSRRLLQLQIFWRQNVIGYNETRRLRLITEIKDSIRTVPKKVAAAAAVFGEAISSLHPLRIASVTILVLSTPFLLYISRRFHIIRKMDFHPRRWTIKNGNVSFYNKMLKLLEKRKIRKPLHLTPLEFLDSPSLREHPMFREIEKLTSLYYRARFGGKALDEQQIAAIHGILLHLKRKEKQGTAAASHKN